MSRTTIIGIAALILVIISAFLPWISIPADGQQMVFTGLNTKGSRFGEPGKLSIGVSVLALVFFLLQKSWTPRVNLFITAFLAAWTFRNMLIFSRCEMGICPDQKAGLYLSMLGAFIAFGCVVFHRNKPAR